MAEPVAKKRALDEKQSKVDFEDFTVLKVLLNDVKSKRVHVHGKFKDSEEDAIVTLMKTPFTESTIQSILSSDTSVSTEFENDIYGQHLASTKPSNNLITTQVIHPATEKHLMKYSHQNVYLLHESAEDYKNITLPYIQKQQFSLTWVYNILDHKKESERILFEDPCTTNGFIFLPDFKWDGKQVEDLYLMAVCHARNLKSIRDLNATHLPLLKNMYNKSMETIKSKYNINREHIRAYFHYYPSYYHLHVHFNHINNDVAGTSAGKAHLLIDVIDNIENIDNEFYQKKALPVMVREQDPLLKLLLN